jgi:hypothetical protein
MRIVTACTTLLTDRVVLMILGKHPVFIVMALSAEDVLRLPEDVLLIRCVRVVASQAPLIECCVTVLPAELLIFVTVNAEGASCVLYKRIMI